MYEVEQNDSYISAGALTADVTGPTYDCRLYAGMSFHAVWTGAGAPVGNFTIQVSNDASTWETYPSSTQAAGGAAGSKIWIIDGLWFKYVRLKYTFGSAGTADTVTVKTFAKGSI